MIERARTPGGIRVSISLLVSLFVSWPTIAGVHDRTGGNGESAFQEVKGSESIVLAALNEGEDGDEDEEDKEREEDGDDERLEFGAELELTVHRIGDFALDTERRDDLWVREAELVGEVTYRPRGDLVLFGELALIAEREVYRGDTPDESVDALERGESWIRWLHSVGESGWWTVGRQTFEDPRRWWWDEDLDSVRLDYARGSWDAFAGLAQELAPTDTSEDFIDPEVDEVRRLLVHAGWSYSHSLRLDLFGLVQRDRSGSVREDRVLDSERVDESDLDAHWLGFRASGTSGRDSAGFSWWSDLAAVRGDENVTEFEDLDSRRSQAGETETRRLRAWAVDLGTEWTFDVAGEPSLGLRYALGSGDRDPDDGTDRAYRETGLRDTEDEFRLYGELLRPALSNLEVATIELGLGTLADGRIRFGYHRFRQVHASDELAEARIEADLTGNSRDIGDELSVVVWFEPTDTLELECAAGLFRAGDAFGAAEGERAQSLFGRLTHEF